jgi:methanogenic corrinoid protein MtbC1
VAALGELGRSIEASSPTGSDTDDGAAPAPEGETVEAFVAAARQLDMRALDHLLDDAFAARRFERAMGDVIFPALRAVGDDWSAGRIDVAAEHAASEAVRRRLSLLYEAAGRSIRGATVVVGLPPASHHEIGAFAFAVAARRAGLGVLYLGANVPLESWLRTVRETNAPVVVLGVVTEADVASATVVAEALRTLESPPLCYLGGPLAHDVPETSGVERLPESIDAAVARVADGIDGPAA